MVIIMRKLYTLIVFLFFHLLIVQGKIGSDSGSESANLLWLSLTDGQLPASTFGISQAVCESTENLYLFSCHPLFFGGDINEYSQSNSEINQPKSDVLDTFNNESNPTNVVVTDVDAVAVAPIKSFKNIKDDSFSGTITVGASGNFTTLTGKGGLFEKLNSGQVNGNITANIISDLTEDGSSVLNAWKEGSGGPFTLIIHPVGFRTINAANGIRLNGTKGVIIDGLNDGLNSLSIKRISGASNFGIIEIYNGASNNTITRTSISGNNVYSNAYVITFYNSSTTPLINNTISYCSISSANTSPASSVTNQGILLTGYQCTAIGNTIDHNTFTNFGYYAIHEEHGIFTNTTISNNEIYNTAAVGSSDNFTGIFLNQDVGVTTIFNNKIHDLLCSSTTSSSGSNGVIGIRCDILEGAVSSIYNNLIYLDVNTTQQGVAYTGIQIVNLGTTNLNYNSIYIGGTNVTSNSSYGMKILGMSDLKFSIVNNIIYNARSNSLSGTGKHYGIYKGATILSDYNDIYVVGKGGCFGYFGTDKSTLTAWQTDTRQDVHSVSVDPLFTSVTNFIPLNAAINTGTPIAGITTDITGSLRDLLTPTLGAYEYVCLTPTDGGIIAADQTVWTPAIPALITSSVPARVNSGVLEYKWQNSVSPFTTWTDIPKSNASTYQPEAILQTSRFKRLARTTCMKTWTGAVESNVITITVNTNKWKGSSDSNWGNPENWTQNIIPPSDADIVFADEPLHDCLLDQNRSVNNIINSQSTFHLVLNGNTLAVKGNLNFTKGAQIDCISPNSTLLFSGAIFQTVPSDAFVNQEVYNLNIGNAVGVTLVSNLSITNLLVLNPGTRLIIPIDATLNVKGKIINNAGTSGLVIKASSTGAVPNGTLIFHNDPIHDPTVPATVEMYTKASFVNGSYRWQFFGIPLKSVQANPTFSGSYVREMHEDVIGTTGHWVQLQNESVLTSFTGYEITQQENKVISFEGVLENADYGPLQLSYTSDATYKGQHLIGNPYMAAINIRNTEIPANSLVFGDGMDKTVYLYNTGSKDDWLGNGLNGGGDGNAAGQYLCIPQENAGSDLLPASIPSMQAFLVMVSTPGSTATLSIPYSSAGTVVKNTTLQRAPGAGKVFTRIDVNGSGYSDRMWLFTNSTCSRGFDNGWDGYKIMGSSLSPQIYAYEDDADYQVNTVDNINNTYLGFKAGIDTSYTLTFTHQNNENHYYSIYLLDLSENKTVDITKTGSQYHFNSNTTVPTEKRFKLIATSLGTDVPTSQNKTDSEYHSLSVFNSNHAIMVKNQSKLGGYLYLYDITGRFIRKLQFTSNAITTFPLQLAVGTYLSKAVTLADEVTNHLIFKE